MPLTSIATDAEALTTTVIADLAAPPERVWQAYLDPRQIEQFWGPPGWPARFHRHDMTVGGRSHYSMTGPEGERMNGYWEVLELDAPRSFTVLDGFANDAGEPDPDMPAMRVVFGFSPTEDGTRLVSVTHHTSLEALEQLTAMGMEEGTRLAMTRIDAVLQGLREFAQGKGVITELFDDGVCARFSRFIDAPVERVWEALTAPELVRRWLLGPDGWDMTAADISLDPGGVTRLAWAPREGVEGAPFALVSTTVFVDAPHRWVADETMEDMPYPPTRNDQTLVEADGGTLLAIVCTYASPEARDAHLATGMTDGMEASYARLEKQLAAV
ncbi:SRPBCC family protein [Demequina pelophila]|uniref:SRPBCC family protein n=1 Tax=Demequina pelophila TaxID=1638984 RepID=UPI000782CAB2|nr:SRPBCC family protein [Demequina pelophila]